MNGIIVYKIAIYLANFAAILIAIPFHEFAHAFAAVRCGDMTPKFSGRYTLNPFAHFDPLGFLMMVFLRFGWAKPVPVNPANFRNYKAGCILVSIAGVLTNLVLAVLFCPLCLISYKFLIPYDWAIYLNDFIQAFFLAAFYLNNGLFVFNLLPLYPLDGFRLYESLSSRRGKVWYFLRNKSFYILIAILLLGVIADYVGIPYLDIIGFLRELAARPIILLWRTILGL
ncbi:MAG TPA: site-2 protease family protein [Clostridiales bacterium]|nr:site-2 protease family protein [Clostridiales bacterium]